MIEAWRGWSSSTKPVPPACMLFGGKRREMAALRDHRGMIGTISRITRRAIATYGFHGTNAVMQITPETANKSLSSNTDFTSSPCYGKTS